MLTTLLRELLLDELLLEALALDEELLLLRTADEPREDELLELLPLTAAAPLDDELDDELLPPPTTVTLPPPRTVVLDTLLGLLLDELLLPLTPTAPFALCSSKRCA